MKLHQLLASREGRARYAEQLAGYNADQLKTRRPFVWVMPNEAHGFETADTYAGLELGQTEDGLWLFSVSVWDGVGGRFAALGYHAPAPEPCEVFSARSEALAAGIASLVAWTERTYAEASTAKARARLRSWGLSLSEPVQADLFTAA